MGEMDWVGEFVREGYFCFPGLIGADAVSRARGRIEKDLAENYDPARKVEYDSRTFCPGIVESPEILGLIEDAAVQKRVDQLVKLRTMDRVTNGQIAIRRAHNVERASVPHAHVDGYPTATNGLKGDTVVPFTMLVGVFLSEVRQEFAGNFTVWPGSHVVVEEYFNREGERARTQPLPHLEIGEPRQLMGSPGDVVICHYQLAHGAAVNVSDLDRVAVFFRLNQKELGNWEGRRYREHVWTHLTKMWTGWRVGV